MEEEKEAYEPLKGVKVIAGMQVSGSQFVVGTSQDSLAIWTDEHQSEAVYFSVVEAEMIIAALKAAIADVKGD